jgi:hypothetical protein
LKPEFELDGSSSRCVCLPQAQYTRGAEYSWGGAGGGSSGSPWDEEGGYPSTSMREGGYPSTSMREGGYPSTSMREGGYPSTSMREGGYPSTSMREGGYPSTSMKPTPQPPKSRVPPQVRFRRHRCSLTGD